MAKKKIKIKIKSFKLRCIKGMSVFMFAVLLWSFIIVTAAGAKENESYFKKDILWELYLMQPEGKLKWFCYLRYKCESAGIDDYYVAMKNIMWLESRYNKSCLEVQNNRVISFGLFQNSLETAKCYRRAKKIEEPKDEIAWLIDPYNNIDVSVWLFSAAYKYFGDFRRAIMAHNLGWDGSIEYWRKNKKFRWPYKQGGINEDYFKSVVWVP